MQIITRHCKLYHNLELSPVLMITYILIIKPSKYLYEINKTLIYLKMYFKHYVEFFWNFRTFKILKEHKFCHEFTHTSKEMFADSDCMMMGCFHNRNIENVLNALFLTQYHLHISDLIAIFNYLCSHRDWSFDFCLHIITHRK